MGQKVPVKRPRVRTTEDKEVRLGSYEMFHRGEPLTETVWEKLMLGFRTRNMARQFASLPKRTVWRRARSAMIQHVATLMDLAALNRRRFHPRTFFTAAHQGLAVVRNVEPGLGEIESATHQITEQFTDDSRIKR